MLPEDVQAVFPAVVVASARAARAIACPPTGGASHRNELIRVNARCRRLKRLPQQARLACLGPTPPGRRPIPAHDPPRRLYILPTRAGLAFAALLFVMLIAGLNYANSIALLLTFLLAGFALVAMHQCHRNLLGVALERRRTRRGLRRRAGAAARSRSRNTARISRATRSKPASLDGAPAADRPAAHARRRRSGRCRSPRRSAASCASTACGSHTTFPFGLFRAWTWVHLPLEVIV